MPPQPVLIFYVGWLVLISLVTFGLYGWDKYQAGQGNWRVPESRLHLLALAGGFPGAYSGQAFFRHKTRKATFQVLTALATAAHLLFVGIVFWLAS